MASFLQSQLLPYRANATHQPVASLTQSEVIHVKLMDITCDIPEPQRGVAQHVLQYNFEVFFHLHGNLSVCLFLKFPKKTLPY